MRMPFLTPMLCCALALLAAPAARGATWYVDAAAAPGGNGTSWAEAFNTVQAGADAAADTGGGEVWVKAGSYPEVQTNGGVSLTMRQRVGLYGGFAGTETARDQRNPELNVTVLVGTADSWFWARTTVPSMAFSFVAAGPARVAACSAFAPGPRCAAASLKRTVPFTMN
jgi:hypothetical protein